MIGRLHAWFVASVCLLIGHKDLVAGSIDGELFSGERVCVRCSKRHGAFMARVTHIRSDDDGLKIVMNTSCRPKVIWASVGGKYDTYD